MLSTRRNRAKKFAVETSSARPGKAGKIALAPSSKSAPRPPAIFARPGIPACLSTLLKKSCAQLLKLLKPKRRRRKLQLLEMQQLGEKRFVAVVRVGRQKFLIGGAATSVTLLAEIGSRTTTAIAPRPLSQESA